MTHFQIKTDKGRVQDFIYLLLLPLILLFVATTYESIPRTWCPLKWPLEHLPLAIHPQNMPLIAFDFDPEGQLHHASSYQMVTVTVIKTVDSVQKAVWQERSALSSQNCYPLCSKLHLWSVMMPCSQSDLATHKCHGKQWWTIQHEANPWAVLGFL